MKNTLRKEIRWLVEEKYGGEETRETAKDIVRLKGGEHIDYVIGWVDFDGCKIDLSKRPLIPRPETEFWAKRAIEEILRSNSKFSFGFIPHPLGADVGTYAMQKIWNFRALDLFAGSGCIGIAVLKNIPLVQIDFAEKEKKLLKQIVINTKLNRIDSRRYRVFQSDVFSNIKGKYDYIFANPPYVAEARKTKVQKSVLEQEPQGAVFGGEDGLRYITKFFTEAKNHLKPDGRIYMEFDSPQKPAITKLLKKFCYTHFDFFKDQYNKWRYARIVF